MTTDYLELCYKFKNNGCVSGLNERQGQCHMQNKCPVIQVPERSAGLGFSNRSIHAGEQTRHIGICPLTPSYIVAYRRRATKQKRTNSKIKEVERSRK
jgi:hypothetical protein